MSIQRHTAQSIAMRWHGSDLWGDGVEYVLASAHVAAVEAAFRDGYNQHARAQQHWQDTHGAYTQHGEGTNP